jgi:hypothetical protein
MKTTNPVGLKSDLQYDNGMNTGDPVGLKSDLQVRTTQSNPQTLNEE